MGVLCEDDDEIALVAIEGLELPGRLWCLCVGEPWWCMPWKDAVAAIEGLELPELLGDLCMGDEW
jgi:hypothetical protein